MLWNDGNGPVVARGALAADAAWAAPTALATASCRGALAQRLAVNASGQAVVLWQRAGAVAGWCARRFEGGVWTAEEVINSTPLVAGVSPGLVLTPAGQAVAVWQLDAFGGLAQAQQDTASSAWSSAAMVVNDAFAGGPVLSAGADGSLALAWARNGGVSAAYRAAGSGLVSQSGSG